MTIPCKPEAGPIIEVNALYVLNMRSQGSIMWSDLTGKTRVSTISWCYGVIHATQEWRTARSPDLSLQFLLVNIDILPSHWHPGSRMDRAGSCHWWPTSFSLINNASQKQYQSHLSSSRLLLLLFIRLLVASCPQIMFLSPQPYGKLSLRIS